MPRPGSGDKEILDTLRLSDESWRELVQTLQDKTPRQDTAEKRRHERIEYIGRIGIAVRHNESNWAKFLVHTRDLSHSGIGFVHGGFFHISSECRVVLRALDQEILCITGVVRRCRFIQGTMHDIGVEFSGPVDADRFRNPGG